LHFGARLVDRSHGFLEHHFFGVRVPALSLTKRSHPKLDDRQPLEQFAVGLPGVLCPKSREQFAVDLDLNGRSHTEKCRPGHIRSPEAVVPVPATKWMPPHVGEP